MMLCSQSEDSLLACNSQVTSRLNLNSRTKHHLPGSEPQQTLLSSLLSFLDSPCAMASLSILRLAARPSASTLFRPCTRTIRRAPLVAQSISAKSPFSSTAVHRSSGHEDETFEEFSARYEKEFDSVQDVFELQVWGGKAFIKRRSNSNTITAKSQQRVRLRSRPFARRLHCCTESRQTCQ